MTQPSRCLSSSSVLCGSLLAVLTLGLPTEAFSQATATHSAEAEQGIPVRSDAVFEACSECHAQDNDGLMTRISYLRKTPEGWESSVRRMVTLNDAYLDPALAREVVRYLSDNHGIAPDELRPGRFESERRFDDHDYEVHDDSDDTCIRCHSIGRVITQRRTKEEWGLLMAMHRGFYPYVDFQAFRYGGPPPGSPGAPEDTRHPMDKAIERYAEAYPLETPEWNDWVASMRPARLAGTWSVQAHKPGEGAVYGQVVIEPVSGSDQEFTTETTLVYGRSGETVSSSGRSVVYTGYQWRGRSSDSDGLREVMMVERDWQEMSGRWFRGTYDEIGLDVTLRRVGTDPVVLGAEPRALQQGASGQQVRIFGANLPGDLSADAVDFGPGVTVTAVESSGGGAASVRVDVASDAVVGPRDLFVAGVRQSDVAVVYDEMHSLKVTPEAGMARTGGGAFPKGYAQFQANAFHNGPDEKSGTEDDYDLGVVDASWSLEEYSATLHDDDIQYVGDIDQNGLVTPALDGPNPERRGEANNIGDLWAVASYVPPGSDGRPLRARAYLLVTVPLYMRWDPWSPVR